MFAQYLDIPAVTIEQVNAPAFSVYQSTPQTAISANTWTKLVFQTEEFDTGGCFDNVTNYRFTPTTAGYYQINATWTHANGTAVRTIISLYKNGVPYFQGNDSTGNSAHVSGLIYFNGSTDYVEAFAYHSHSPSLQPVASGIYQTKFSGSMTKKA